MSNVWLAPVGDVDEGLVSKDAELGPGLLVEVWHRPRAVARAVMAQGGTYGVLGLGATMGWAEMSFTGNASAMPGAAGPLLAGVMLGAPVMGVLLTYLQGVSAYAGARVIGASPRSVQKLTSAVAWGRVPATATQLPLSLLLAWVWWSGWEVPSLLLAGLAGLSWVGWLWSWATTGHTVGEVLQVSAGRGVLATLVVPVGLSTLLLVFAGAMLLLGGFAG